MKHDLYFFAGRKIIHLRWETGMKRLAKIRVGVSAISNSSLCRLNNYEGNLDFLKKRKYLM